jgi:peptidylprolyl isomerase
LRTFTFCLFLIAAALFILGAAGTTTAQQLPAAPAPKAQIPPPAATPGSKPPGASAQPPQPQRPQPPVTAQVPPQETPLDFENTLYLDLEYGRVIIKMHPELAPKHVLRIKELVREGFYDGIVFHRVIDSFMAQTGDPKGNGTGGSGKNIPAEFTPTSNPAGAHVRGAVSMARSSNINSGDSQFFIVLGDSDFLDGQYTYWGEVVSGMDFVDKIRKGDSNDNGSVPYPDRIVRLQVAADVQKAGAKPAAH